jgi:fructose-specific component phosphotransferase system IIB-like protein
MAASRSGTSTRNTPASASFVSAKGPSWTRSTPSRRVTVVDAATACSTSADSSTPADSSARPYAPNASRASASASSLISPSAGSR